ncbi:MAG: hypothetical protein EB828_04555 [Nitrosopumilus sp. D6]|nr:MAG: hypothetical protein EB828_04555 [Nitrosopumilus sp. D6]
MAHEMMYRIRNCEQDKSDLKHARMIAKLEDKLDASHGINKELLERIDILHGTIRQLSESGAHMHESRLDYDQHANKPAQKSCKVRISESA